MATTKTISVCITRCDKCGHERYGFAPASGNCPRCASPFFTPRWIAHPAPETIAQAAEEGGGVGVRILARAAEYDRCGDTVLRDQAVRESDATATQAADFFARVKAGEAPMLAAFYATR